MGPREVRSGKEVMVSCGRTDYTIPVVATSTSEPGTAVPWAVNGGGVEKKVDESEHDVDVRESRTYILDFEDVLNEIDDAICNGPGNPELKAAISEKNGKSNGKHFKSG